MAENIDPVRLAAILEAGQAALAHSAALGREADDIREALRHARLQAEAGRRAVTGKGNVVVMECTPEALAKIDALQEQYRRLDERRTQLWAEMGPKCELARNCYKFAREQKIEVGHYDL